MARPMPHPLPFAGKPPYPAAMEPVADYWTLRDQLEWQVELGVTEAIADAPVDRYAQPDEPAAPAARPRQTAPEVPAPPAGPDPVAVAQALAARARSLDELAESQSGFDLCELRRGARSFVFADGNPAARVMVIGEAPGRDEDLAGRPFVGVAGQLLDRMLAAIGLSRGAADAGQAVYITNVMPWRPPGNRTPEPAEIAMMLPFVHRHIELADPEVILLMGNTPCQALLGKTGITRLRGTWDEVAGRPVMPMLHPAYLLRMASAKREAWADLLAVKARLRGDAL